MTHDPIDFEKPESFWVCFPGIPPCAENHHPFFRSPFRLGLDDQKDFMVKNATTNFLCGILFGLQIPETNMSPPDNRASQKEFHLPTILLLVSGRISIAWFLATSRYTRRTLRDFRFLDQEMGMIVWDLDFRSTAVE